MGRLEEIFQQETYKEYKKVESKMLRREKIRPRDQEILGKELTSIRMNTLIGIFLSLIFVCFIGFVVTHMGKPFVEVLFSSDVVFVIAGCIFFVVMLVWIRKFFSTKECNIKYAQYGEVISTYRLSGSGNSNDKYYANVAFHPEQTFVTRVLCDFKQRKDVKVGDTMLVFSFNERELHGVKVDPIDFLEVSRNSENI